MTQINFNENGLTHNDIDKVVRKARAIVINEAGQALLVKYAGLYMLPGGSIDEGETAFEALKREISEETGIEINTIKENPFLLINSYDKDYPSRKYGTINKLTQTAFFEIKTNQPVNESRQRLTKSEIENNHTVEYKNLSIMKYLVETSKSNNPKKIIFDREILTALREYERMKINEKTLYERC